MGKKIWNKCFNKCKIKITESRTFFLDIQPCLGYFDEDSMRFAGTLSG